MGASRIKLLMAMATSIAVAACSTPTPMEVIGTERITLEEAASQAADAIKAFRLRLASGRPGEDAEKYVVPAEYKTGLQFCALEMKFYVSAKADKSGKLTLAVPLSLSFAGPNPPMNTLNPQITAEQGGTAAGERNNTITIKMENLACANFAKIADLVAQYPHVKPDRLVEMITLGVIQSSQQMYDLQLNQ